VIPDGARRSVETASVPRDNAYSWDRLAEWYQAHATIATDTASYGLDAPTEAELRLCGDLNGKRVLDLGCAGAQSAISFALKGAKVIGVDPSAEQLAHARRLAEQHGTKVELRTAELSDLAFLTNGSIDLVFSAGALDFVEDVSRVFRQVHRVLRTGGTFVFSVTHPIVHLLDVQVSQVRARPDVRGGESLVVQRSYWDHRPIDWDWNDVPFTSYHRTVSELFGALHRAGLQLDVLLEPEPASGGPRSITWNEAYRMVPPTLIMRSHKEGS